MDDLDSLSPSELIMLGAFALTMAEHAEQKTPAEPTENTCNEAAAAEIEALKNQIKCLEERCEKLESCRSANSSRNCRNSCNSCRR